MKSLIAITLAAIALSACSSVTPIPNNEWVMDYGKGCVVTIYQTEAEAEKHGEIVELCTIDGTSSGSFNHSPETAIRKHAKKACKCDSNKVYVQSRARADWGVAKASLIAFKYEGETNNNRSSSVDSYEAIKRKKD